MGPVARSLDSVINWIAKLFKLVKKVFLFVLRQRNFVIFDPIFDFNDCSVRILYFLLFESFNKSFKKLLSIEYRYPGFVQPAPVVLPVANSRHRQ